MNKKKRKIKKLNAQRNYWYNMSNLKITDLYALRQIIKEKDEEIMILKSQNKKQ